jgi:thiol-disulfide isomerase/thioredoxin
VNRWSAVGLLLPALLPACGRRDDSTLLFFRRSPVAYVAGAAWAADPERSRLIVFHGLRPIRVVGGAVASPVAVAALGDYVLVTELTGEGLVLDTSGRLVRAWPSPAPFPVAVYATSGARVLAARSPYRVPVFGSEPAPAPLLQVLDTLGRPLAGLAAIRSVPFLTAVVNAGVIAAAGEAVYYAPMVRDEITQYGPGGARGWTASRGLRPRESDPEFLPNRGRELPLRQAIVNVAITLGPDGRLYVLGATDSAATRLRLDVLDTASGRILTTRDLGQRETAIALAADGSITTLDADSLAAGAPAGERQPFTPAFALPTLAGDTLRLGDYAGRVTLVNFWASWCDPCREEFPLMAGLYRSLPAASFGIAAISDDVDAGAMRRFAALFDPPFPLLAGGGRMKGTYHYRGLPYSLLLDRQGRVIERIFGFGGERQFARLRETIAKEIANP